MKSETERQILDGKLANSIKNASELEEQLRDSKCNVENFQSKNTELESSVRKLRAELMSSRTATSNLEAELTEYKKNRKSILKVSALKCANEPPLSRGNSDRWSGRPSLKRRRSSCNLDAVDSALKSPQLKKL